MGNDRTTEPNPEPTERSEPEPQGTGIAGIMSVLAIVLGTISVLLYSGSGSEDVIGEASGAFIAAILGVACVFTAGSALSAYVSS